MMIVHLLLLPQAYPSLQSPACDDTTTVFGLHAREKAVFLVPLSVVPFAEHRAGAVYGMACMPVK